MPRPFRSLLVLALLAFCASPARATLDKGTLLIAPTVTAGTADFVSESGGFLSAYDHGEIGLGGEAWYFLDDATALSGAGQTGRFKETNTDAAGVSRTYTQRSWSARAGLDRVLQYRQDALFYFGPGVEFWRGNSHFLNFGPGDEDTTTPEVTRWSLSARFGGIMVIGDNWGFVGHIGWRVGRASAEADGAKTTWDPNGFEGGAGVVIALGR
jgi:hypothetical protein